MQTSIKRCFFPSYAFSIVPFFRLVTEKMRKFATLRSKLVFGHFCFYHKSGFLLSSSLFLLYTDMSQGLFPKQNGKESWKSLFFLLVLKYFHSNNCILLVFLTVLHYYRQPQHSITRFTKIVGRATKFSYFLTCLDQWFSTLNAGGPLKINMNILAAHHYLSEIFFVSFMYFMELKLTYFVFSWCLYS